MGQPPRDLLTARSAAGAALAGAERSTARIGPARSEDRPQQEASEEALELPPLDAVYRRYASYVAAIGHQILGREDEVDDLIQDVFVEAHRGLHRLRHPTALKRWLAAVTVRAATRRLRRRKLRRFLRLEEAPDEAEPVSVTASPEDQAVLSAVRRALEAMPARDRVVWILRHVQGETLEEIVTLTGQSLSTVQRALRRSEARLYDEVGDPPDHRGGDHE